MSFIEKYIVEPFRYITSDWLKVLIGGLLLFFSLTLDWILSILLGPFSFILILVIDLVVIIAINGYYIAVIKNTLEGLDTLPDWSNLGEILRDGALYIGALFILLLVVYLPAILLLSIVGLLFDWATTTLLLLLYVSVSLIALMIYVPLAMVNFAKKGFLGFFEVVDILKKISLEYLGIQVIYTVLGIGIVVIFYLMATISLFFLFLILSLGILCFLLSMLVVSVVNFGLWIMFSRAVARYYLEKELRG